ncbi:DUF937 domain-containing protein [Arthrobacter sp. ISL-5]|uniref:DUF937 domain-containing protein n=1 Tax=Arthrobacter sp. ISL-5 TaxID=2819111 RepID=UPI001BE8424E|nr:DUF937 domain-containing protein [Arthrobacter sp. ISL-5]MBT2554194.1 DUF937 domain-containing protein [Arthrobacter sp. ISL-5]
MTDIHDLLDQIPVDQIAALLGTDTASARAAVETAVPTLLAGMQNNAQAPDGAASLESALAQHQDGLTDGGVDATQVDTADGEKIVSHVFGGQQDQVASQLAGTANLGGAGGDLVRKLLPILAPIIMSYLAKKILGGPQGGGQASPLPGGIGAGGAAGRAGGIDIGSILGGILGGAAGAGGQGQGGLGDILGGILGGGQPQGGQPLDGQPLDALAPEPMNDSTSQQPAEPLGQPTRQSGAPVPGELIEVDLPDGPDEKPEGRKNDDGGDAGLGGLLGGLFGKK